jgi:hypothetical protein
VAEHESIPPRAVPAGLAEAQVRCVGANIASRVGSTTTLGSSSCQDSASTAANASGVAARGHRESSGEGKEVRPGQLGRRRRSEGLGHILPRSLVDSVLGAAQAYDREHESDLVRTVQTWLELERQAGSAATALTSTPTPLRTGCDGSRRSAVATSARPPTSPNSGWPCGRSGTWT